MHYFVEVDFKKIVLYFFVIYQNKWSFTFFEVILMDLTL